jgi:hypothetical protein
MSGVKGNRNAKVLFLVIAIVLIAVSTIIIVQPHSKEVKEANGSYYVGTDMILMDSLKNNTLYPNGTILENPSTIYTNITRNIFISESVTFSDTAVSISNVSTTYKVTMLSENPQWSKNVVSIQRNFSISSGTSKKMIFSVNISSNLSEARYIDKELGYNAGVPSISLYISTVTSTAAGSAGSNLTISIGSPTDSIKLPLNVPSSGTYYKNAVIPGKIIIPLPAIYAYSFLVTGVAFIILGLLTLEYVKPDATRKFLNEHKDVLIQLKAGPPVNSIEVHSTEDVIKMATFVEKPVFIYENLIFIELDGKTYFSEIDK